MVPQIDVYEIRGVEEVGHLVDRSDVDQDRMAEQVGDSLVRLPCRADRSDFGRLLALEDGEQPSDESFDRLLEDDVGLVDTRPRPRSRVVVDLERECRPLRDLSAGCRSSSSTGRPAARAWSPLCEVVEVVGSVVVGVVFETVFFGAPARRAERPVQ